MISVKDYGALGDGVTDDTGAFISALNTSPRIYVPFTTNGYLLNGSMNLANAGISGDPGTKLIHNSNNVLFSIIGNNVHLDQLIIDSTSSNNAQIVINNANPIDNISIKNIKSISSAGCITDVYSNVLNTNIHISNIISKAPKGVVVALSGYLHQSSIKDVYIDYAGSVAPDHAGIAITHGNTISTSCFIHNINVQGSDNSLYSSQHGVVLGTAEGTNVSNINTLHMGGYGFFANGTINFRLTNSNFSFGHQDQMRLNSSLYSSISNCMARGRANGILTSLTSATYGISLHDCTSINISNCDAKSNGAGIWQDSSVDITITGGQSSVNTYYGLVSTGTGSTGLVTGMCFSNNSLANVNHTGDGQFVANCRANNGSLITKSGKGVS